MCVATKIYSIITVLLRKAGNIKWTMNSPNHIGDVHEANRESVTSQKLPFLESCGSTFILRSESCHFVIQECNPQNQISRRAWDVACVCHEPIELTEDEALSVVSDFGDVSMVPK